MEKRIRTVRGFIVLALLGFVFLGLADGFDLMVILLILVCPVVYYAVGFARGNLFLRVGRKMSRFDREIMEQRVLGRFRYN